MNFNNLRYYDTHRKDLAPIEKNGEKTVIKIVLADTTTVSFSTQAVSVIVDWGDGTIETTSAPSHEYQNAGTYYIVIDNQGNTIYLSGSGDYGNLDTMTELYLVDGIYFSGFAGHTNLQKLTIKSSQINALAFSGCTSLTKIIIATDSVPTLEANTAFSNTNNAPIYVNPSLYSSFIGATNWTTLSDRIKSTVSVDYLDERISRLNGISKRTLRSTDFQYDGGVGGYATYVNNMLTPLHKYEMLFVNNADRQRAIDCGLYIVVVDTDSYGTVLFGANSQPTGDMSFLLVDLYSDSGVTELNLNLPLITGLSGTVTLETTDWTNNVATKTFTDLRADDLIDFYPSSVTDKANASSSDIFVSANANTVTFTATTTPSANITFNYFITRGKV